MAVDVIQFLTTVEPPYGRRDTAAVLAALTENWTPDALVEMLFCGKIPATKLAAACLGMTGEMRHCGRLATLLSHDDDQVVEVAEDALWGIWMRAGDASDNLQLAAAIDAIRRENHAEALAILSDLTTGNPVFAEATHQQAIAYHCQQRLDDAADCYELAASLNPYHFAARAGLGHVCVERGDLEGALRWYRSALAIHPHLAEIHEIVPQLESALSAA